MPASFLDATDTGNAVSTTSRSVAVPAGVSAGTVVVCSLSRWEPSGRTAVTPPSGFTHIGAFLSSNGNATVDVWWKRLIAADAGSYTFSWSGSMWSELHAIAFDGVVTSGDPVVSTDSWSGTAGTFGDTTVTADEGAALIWRAYNDTPDGYAAPTGFTLVVAVDVGGEAYRIAPSTGLHTASGGSVSTSSPAAAVLVALAPAVGGGTEITGSGTVTAAGAVASGAAAVTLAGGGTASAAPALLDGSASVVVTGQAAATGPAAAVAGAGSVLVAGSGQATSQAATVAGSGSALVAGAGQLTAAAATVAGTGNIGDPPVTGSGHATAPAAAGSGTGTVEVTGAGVAAAAAATLAGAAEVRVDGNGVIVAPGMHVDGSGAVVITGAGQAVAPASVTSGSELPPPPIPELLVLTSVPGRHEMSAVRDELTLTSVRDELTLTAVEEDW